MPLTAPALGSRGQRCSWSFSPCKGCSPGSTQLLMLAGSNTPWPSSELCSNPMALLCQLVLFPREKLFLWLIAGAAFPSPAAEHLPLACGRQHKGALWEAQGAGAGKHSSHCSSRALAKHKGQNIFSFDRRKTILFVGETSN